MNLINLLHLELNQHCYQELIIKNDNQPSIMEFTQNIVVNGQLYHMEGKVIMNNGEY